MSKGGNVENGRVYLLTGKVASGKTTYARKVAAEGNAVYLSIDELQLSIFGPAPTREQLGSSYEGACVYQLKIAIEFLTKGIDVLLDWGLWSKSERKKYRVQIEGLGFDVKVVYFKVSDETRRTWNAHRNSGDDATSFKIEPHDMALFDSMYEEPSEDEFDTMVTS